MIARPRFAMAAVSVVAVFSVVMVGVLVVSPRHRAFYGAWLVRPPGVQPVAGARPRPTMGTPGLSPHALRVDAKGQLHVRLADVRPAHLPLDGVPSGWRVHPLAGDPDTALVQSEAGLALRLRSKASAFVLYRDLTVDLADHSVLSWAWKVVRLPMGGDGRRAGRADEAARVCVVFPHWPSPMTESRVIGYVWDTAAPVGTVLTRPPYPNLRLIVLESGPARAGVWQPEARDVAADYRTLFGTVPPFVGMIAVMTDSNDTGGESEAFIADLTFARRS